MIWRTIHTLIVKILWLLSTYVVDIRKEYIFGTSIVLNKL